MVRLTGSEDVNWLYVQLSRGRQDTRLYAVVGPEPNGAGELDLPDREQPDAYPQLAQALARTGGQNLAIDTPPTTPTCSGCPRGKVVTQGVPVVTAGRLPSMLRALPAVLGPERVAWLADQARIRFHAAA